MAFIPEIAEFAVEAGGAEAGAEGIEAEGSAEAYGGEEEGPEGEDGEGDHPSRAKYHCSHTTTLGINQEGWRLILHHPIVVEAIKQRATGIAEAANDMSITRNAEEKADYVVTIQNWSPSSSTRARARVKTGNLMAKLDNASHSTLLHAMDMFPSDPKDNESASYNYGHEDYQPEEKTIYHSKQTFDNGQTVYRDKSGRFTRGPK